MFEQVSKTGAVAWFNAEANTVINRHRHGGSRVIRREGNSQAMGQLVDRRADVFSVGIMLWEVATRRRLWKDMDDLNIVQALVGGSLKSSPRAIDPAPGAGSPSQAREMKMGSNPHRRPVAFAPREARWKRAAAPEGLESWFRLLRS